MPNNDLPKSHGRFGHEEIGMEFTAPEQKKVKSKKNNFFSKFKKSKEKSDQAARQNLE